MRALLLLGVLGLCSSVPPLAWLGCALRRGWRERHVRGGLLRALLSTYAALVSLLAALAVALLTGFYGAGIVIAIVLSPLIVTVGASAECLWEKHTQVSCWLAAAPLALVALLLHQRSSAGWVEALALGHALLALAVLGRARRELGAPTAPTG